MSKLLYVYILLLISSCKDNSSSGFSVKKMEPAVVTARGGTEILISGSGLPKDAIILMDGKICELLENDSETIRFLTLPGIAPESDLRITDSSGKVMYSGTLELLPLELEFREATDDYIPAINLTSVSGIEVGDFNGDGWNDIFIAAPYGSSKILENTSSGLFIDITTDSTEILPYIYSTGNLTMADFNSDGIDDVFICSGDGNSSILLKGNSEFKFEVEKIFDLQDGNCHYSFTMDQDGDAKKDLVIINKTTYDSINQLSYYRNISVENEAGTIFDLIEFENTADSTSLGEFYVSTTSNYGNMYLDDTESSSGKYSCIIEYDFVSGEGYNFYTLQNKTGISFVPTGIKMDVSGDASGAILSFRIWDSNGERYLKEIGPVDWQGWVTLEATDLSTFSHFSGDENGVFNGPVQQVSIQINYAEGVTSGTLKIDNIELFDENGTTGIIENFERVKTLSFFGNEIVTAGTRDLDGDLHDDLVMITGSSPPVVIQTGSNDASKITHFEYSAAQPVLYGIYKCVLTEDFDSDGDIDIFLVNAAGQDQLLMNDGRGHFFDTTTDSLPFDQVSGTHCISADIDRDGSMDILTAGSESYVRLYRNRGNGTFEDLTPKLALYAENPGGLALSDVDNDGDLDVLLYDNVAGLKLFVLRNIEP